MKREIVIYAGLLLSISILFSFEFMVKNTMHDLPFSSYEANVINSISFDVPANVYFIQGNEDKIILEGSSFILDQLTLQHDLGQFKLKKKSPFSLFNKVQELLAQDPAINMYIIARDIESINVINRNGCLANNVLFNDDRGIMEVDDSSIIQFTRSDNTDYEIIRSHYYLEAKTQSIRSCL